MLRLNLKKDPYWMDLPAGVRLRVRPLSSAIMSAAQSAVIKQMAILRQERKARLDAGIASADLPDVDDEDTRTGLTEALLVTALARGAIIDWEGVMDRAGHTAARVNEQTIQELMTIWFIAQDFWKQYTAELALLEIEGNASGLAADGTLAAGHDTVTGAMSNSSPVVEANPAP